MSVAPGSWLLCPACAGTRWKSEALRSFLLGIAHQLQYNSAALNLSNFGEHSIKKKKILSLVVEKSLNAYVLPKVSQRDQSMTRTSYLRLQIWILLCWDNSPVYTLLLATFSRTPQCPLCHGMDKPITQLKCRWMLTYPRGSLFAQGIVRSGLWCLHHVMGWGSAWIFLAEGTHV